MAQSTDSIAQSIIDKRQSRTNKKASFPRIRGAIKPKYEVSIALHEPNNYNQQKFLIESVNGFAMSNPTNYTKEGNGKTARYAITIKGGDGYYVQNMFDLEQYYGEYNWQSILHNYPNNVSSYKDVQSYLMETAVIYPRSIYDYNGIIFICGEQPQCDGIGMIYNMFNFDLNEYLKCKNIINATVAAPPKTLKTLDVTLLLSGNNDNYNYELEIICLRRSLTASQQLNNILSNQVSNASQDGLNMMDQQMGRNVSQNGAIRGAKGELYLPRSVCWGPNGVIEMIEKLAGKKWNIEETRTKKSYDITLDNKQYRLVFGLENAIKKQKNGKFFVQEMKLNMILKKKKGELQDPAKITFKYDGIINGKLTKADGSFQWLRVGQ